MQENYNPAMPPLLPLDKPQTGTSIEVIAVTIIVIVSWTVVWLTVKELLRILDRVFEQRDNLR